MSDGGGENRKDEHCLKKNLGGSTFGNAIAKVAVAQICAGSGFQGFQQFAVQTLSDIAVQYIHNLGKSSQYYANMAGRTECSVFDVLQGLEDLGTGQGFSGASDISHCIGNSGMVHEIIQYVSEAQEIPFAYSVSRFPVHRDRKRTLSFLHGREEPPGEHIPAWLPNFPEPHTYLHLLAQPQNEGPTDPSVDNIENARQQRKSERSSPNLQQRLACNGSGSGWHPVIDNGDGHKGRQATESNPFVDVTLKFGDTEFSSLSLPPKPPEEKAAEQHTGENTYSILETFAPAIEAVKSGLSEAEEGQSRYYLNQRPAVHFKIGVPKKSLGLGMDLSSQSKGFEKTSQWLLKDNEKDDKKRRAEKILKESIENPQELAQL